MDRPTYVDLAPMMPTSGIIPYYVSEAKRLTRAPTIYHLASLVTVLGAVLDPVSCCHLVLGPGLYREERLFLWMLLIGPTGNKKTYASELALEATSKFTSNRVRGPEGGRKGLEDMLVAEPYAVVHMREAAAWFAGNRMAYSGDGATFWTQVYDGSYIQRNVADPGRAPKRFKVGVTILAMGPKREIEKKTRVSDWESGLLARLCLCSGPDIEKGPGGAKWPTPVLRKLHRGIASMERMAEDAYRITVTREAHETWNLWCDRHDRVMASKAEMYEKLCSRLNWHVLRWATIYAASRFSTTVERRDMVAACNFGRWLRDSALSMEPGY